MECECRYAAVALGLALLAMGTGAAARDVADGRRDAGVLPMHAGYRVDSATATVSPAMQDAGCGPGLGADPPDEHGRAAWRDRSRRVHGSGLIDNCTIAPEPDDRDPVARMPVRKAPF